MLAWQGGMPAESDCDGRGDHGPHLMTTAMKRMTATMTIASSDGRNDDNNK